MPWQTFQSSKLHMISHELSALSIAPLSAVPVFLRGCGSPQHHFLLVIPLLSGLHMPEMKVASERDVHNSTITVWKW